MQLHHDFLPWSNLWGLGLGLEKSDNSCSITQCSWQNLINNFSHLTNLHTLYKVICSTYSFSKVKVMIQFLLSGKNSWTFKNFDTRFAFAKTFQSTWNYWTWKKSFLELWLWQNFSKSNKSWNWERIQQSQIWYKYF